MHLLLLIWTWILPILAANPNAPHPHTGIATKFTNPTKVTLTSTELTTLSKGEPVLKQVQEGNGGRGIAVFDVDASQAQVWQTITSFGNYPVWIDELSKCETYKKNDNEIFVDFVISTWGVSVEYYIQHDYQPQKGYMTWTLDYTVKATWETYWILVGLPSPLDPSKTRVEYSVDLRIKVGTWIHSNVLASNLGLKI